MLVERDSLVGERRVRHQFELAVDLVQGVVGRAVCDQRVPD